MLALFVWICTIHHVIAMYRTAGATVPLVLPWRQYTWHTLAFAPAKHVYCWRYVLPVPRQVLYSDADLRQPKAIREMVARVAGELGGLDILHNNAGGFLPSICYHSMIMLNCPSRKLALVVTADSVMREVCCRELAVGTLTTIWLPSV